MKADAPLLVVDDLEVRFPASGTGLFGLGNRAVRAVDGVSLRLGAGETLGLVGESGSGKSTLGRAILGLTDITAGSVVYDGRRVSDRGRDDLAALRRETAMVFQDPYGALNPRQAVGAAVAEVLTVHRKVPQAQVADRVADLFRLVGLDPSLADRRPHALSGGQCQRVGIARALAVEPRLIIADECVAALDVSIQGQIINLLMDLQARMRLGLIFIAHDLAIVRRLCDRVAVMYLGRIVEEGPTAEVFRAPRHPYTAALIRAIPEIDPDRRLPAEPLGGDPPSPLDPPAGCRFHPRCPSVLDTCRRDPPPVERREGDHRWTCVIGSGAARDEKSEPERATP
jgi:peptide/nickel transport system ATP-binding protein